MGEGSEKEPLAVVGSPYWMAPEVLRGEIYNEKADVFAYGIILCETIARVPADPDYLPRTKDFGLDVTTFRTMVGTDCPAAFLQLAFHCCSMEPTSRPSFLEIMQCLEGVLQHQPGLLVAGDSLLCLCPGVARRAAGRTEQLPLCKLGMQHLQPDQHLSCSQSNMFPPKSPTLLWLLEPYGGARTKEPPPRVNPFSQCEDLKGGKTKLFDMPSKSIISLTFNLPPSVPCDFLAPNAIPRKCCSLPASPELPHRWGLVLGIGSPCPTTNPQPPALLLPPAWGQASPPNPEAEEQMDCGPDSPELPQPWVEQGWGQRGQCVYVCVGGPCGAGGCPHASSQAWGAHPVPDMGRDVQGAGRGAMPMGQCPGRIASTGVAPCLPNGGC
uniref:Protein kinase domain-containing protein n=1 Tax=Accipiter nisus TaxID=211598 RepID=A0A8B9NG57_9AVES